MRAVTQHVLTRTAHRHANTLPGEIRPLSRVQSVRVCAGAVHPLHGDGHLKSCMHTNRVRSRHMLAQFAVAIELSAPASRAHTHTHILNPSSVHCRTFLCVSVGSMPSARVFLVYCSRGSKRCQILLRSHALARLCANTLLHKYVVALCRRRANWHRPHRSHRAVGASIHTKNKRTDTQNENPSTHVRTHNRNRNSRGAVSNVSKEKTHIGLIIRHIVHSVCVCVCLTHEIYAWRGLL